MNPFKTILKPLTCSSGPFLYLQTYGDGGSASLVIHDLTPDDLFTAAVEYQAALEAHHAESERPSPDEDYNANEASAWEEGDRMRDEMRETG